MPSPPRFAIDTTDDARARRPVHRVSSLEPNVGVGAGGLGVLLGGSLRVPCALGPSGYAATTRMSWLMARIYDRFMRETEAAGLDDWRHELIAPLAGDVLEIGSGTGANLRHYGPGVRRLVLSEPEPNMRRRLLARVDADRPGAEVVEHAADGLPFDAASFDAVVCTLVLCSVPRPDAVLAEARRLLKPGGRFVFIEHVAAEDRPQRLRWQRRIEPVWVRVADGCHLTRRTEQLIEAAGFHIEAIQRSSMRKALPFVRPSIRGVARK